MTLADGDRRHGTEGGYTKRGCRCDLCRAANAAAQHDYARLRSMQVPCPGCGGFKDWRSTQCQACCDRDRIAVCGTEGGYRSGCRCRLCQEAASAARQTRRDRRRVPCSVCGTPGCYDPRDTGPRGGAFPRCRRCARKRLTPEPVS